LAIVLSVLLPWRVSSSCSTCCTRYWWSYFV
jgi:hypothetical protein